MMVQKIRKGLIFCVKMLIKREYGLAKMDILIYNKIMNCIKYTVRRDWYVNKD